MIRYSLVCDKRHEFEAWFKDSSDYDRQCKRKLVACPTCASTKIEKALMAPALGRSAKKSSAQSSNAIVAPVPPPPAPEAKSPVAMVASHEREFRQKLKELRDHLTRNADNVGAKFPEEARKMHYGEIEHRSIYGEASAKDAKELHEEGIEFHPLPVLPEDKN